jgi:hypothetical protein
MNLPYYVLKSCSSHVKSSHPPYSHAKPSLSISLLLQQTHRPSTLPLLRSQWGTSARLTPAWESSLRHTSSYSVSTDADSVIASYAAKLCVTCQVMGGLCIQYVRFYAPFSPSALHFTVLYCTVLYCIESK